MEHKNLVMEYDKDLIEKILDDIDMRYIILFLYVIRNDLFKNLTSKKIIEAYEKILELDEIYKTNILNFWNQEFIEIAIDLGLFKNIRSVREFEQKDEDFIVKLGEETITIENEIISVPADTLFLIINKKFKNLTRRNFNLALPKLKDVRCERSNVIHHLISEIGEHDYTLSDDLYIILDQIGNVYQTIKIEITIEGFYQRFKEIQDKIAKFIEIFDPTLNNLPIIKKITKAIKEQKDIIKSLKDEKVELPEKFNFEKIDKNHKIFKNWYSKLLSLLDFRFKSENIETKLLGIKRFYSGKEKKYNYLKFIEKVSFNEDNIINNIQDSLIELRSNVIELNEKISKFNRKELKLLNLDYERLLITSSDDSE
ncbi:MAG: hypothetical protein ACFFD5_09945 [Candidatus Thorarchaeota archaeon]